MIKKIILVLTIIFSFSNIIFANEQKAIDDFNLLISKIKTDTNATFTDEYCKVFYIKAEPQYGIEEQWSKSRIDHINISYDIKKSDSLISPYIGIINIKNTYKTFYPLVSNDIFKTKEDAINATLYKLSDGDIIYTYTYAYQNNKWILKNSYNSYDGILNATQYNTDDTTTIPIREHSNKKST